MIFAESFGDFCGVGFASVLIENLFVHNLCRTFLFLFFLFELYIRMFLTASWVDRHHECLLFT